MADDRMQAGERSVYTASDPFVGGVLEYVVGGRMIQVAFTVAAGFAFARPIGGVEPLAGSVPGNRPRLLYSQAWIHLRAGWRKGGNDDR